VSAEVPGLDESVLPLGGEVASKLAGLSDEGPLRLLRPFVLHSNYYQIHEIMWYLII
jgi:hypothetical protein